MIELQKKEEAKESLTTLRMILFVLLIMFLAYDIYLASVSSLKEIKLMFWIPTITLGVAIAIITLNIKKIDSKASK